MRNRIQKSMIFVVTMSLLISYILVTLVIYRQALDIRRSELVQEAGYIRAAIEISGEEYFGTMDKVSKRTRVTWIDKDGKVLYDTGNDQETLANHKSRKEFKEALANGSGQDIRMSDSKGQEMYYYALKMDDSSVLRVSRGMDTVWNTAFMILPYMIAIGVMMACVAWFMTRHQVKRLIAPINNLDLEEPLENDVYEELHPLLERIDRQNKEKAAIEQMRREFSANVSHELKTPLMSISGYAELMMNGMVRPENIADFSGRIYKEANRLGNLVADIIQLSRLDEQQDAVVSMESVELDELAKDVVRSYNYSGNMTGKVNYKADTIYEILGLNKVNTRTLQAIDGNHYELRLLQVAQQLDIQMKPEQLKEFYETFECNTDLLKEKNRRVSLHKLCRYIDKESERYPIGEKNACMWGYSYNRYKERTDPRIERKQNMAHDWLEYIGWCRELKYDLDNKFIYMPNNFKKVHDRTAEEYKALQDKKAAAEKKRREKLAAKKMAETKKAMEEIFSRNDGVDAFQIKGKGLILVVPESGDEIRKEGEALHHCVGGYVDRVARGETNIFFIRKADHPEKSYFTMEWRNNKIIQCRGFKNCGMPADVQAFVKVFEKKMNEAIQGDNKKNAKRKAG